MKHRIAFLVLLAALLPAFAQEPTPYTATTEAPAAVTIEEVPPNGPLPVTLTPAAEEAVETEVAEQAPDIFGGLLARFGTLALAIWGMTFFIGNASGWSKERVALVLGPIGGIIAYGTGWVDFKSASVLWGFVGSAFVGLAGTIAAGTLQDYVVKAATRGANQPIGRT